MPTFERQRVPDLTGSGVFTLVFAVLSLEGGQNASTPPPLTGVVGMAGVVKVTGGSRVR